MSVHILHRALRHVARNGALALVAVGMILTPGSAVAVVTRSELTPLWDQLDLAVEKFRGLPRTSDDLTTCNGARGPEGNLKGYDDMVADFRRRISDGDERTPEAILRQLAIADGGFRSFLTGPAAEEAAAGTREALNDLLAGRLVVGNDRLVKAFQRRFPNGPVGLPTADELLDEAIATFRSALNDALTILVFHPQGVLRAEGTVNSYQWFVENVPRRPNTTGEVVESEFYRIGEVVFRHALAGNARGHRIFFENGSGDDPRDQSGRKSAARLVKRSGQATYVSHAMLAALQTPPQVRRNYGTELPGVIAEAQSIYDDIQSGFNPLSLRGDFVPGASFEDYLAEFDRLREHAKSAEDNFYDRLLKYDQDQTRLAETLTGLRGGLLSEISRISGISRDDIDREYNDLASAGDRSNFFLAVQRERGDETSDGEIRERQRDIELAVIDARIAHRKVQELSELIEIENRRFAGKALATNRFGLVIAAHRLAYDLASAIDIVGVGQPSVPVPIADPKKVAAAQGNFQGNVLALMQSITIEGIDSNASIQRYLVEQATAFLGVERAAKQIESSQAALQRLEAELRRRVEDYVGAREGLACAYYTNPAYRIRLENTRLEADRDFRLAMAAGYDLVKVLEYYWAEKFTNPIVGNCSGPNCSVSDYGGFIRHAESVFAVRSAGQADLRPNLQDFRQALSTWNLRLKSIRGQAQTTPNCEQTYSLRTRLLQLGSADEELSKIMFRDLISKSRRLADNTRTRKRDVVLDFGFGLHDGTLVATSRRNVRIDTLAVTLRARAGSVPVERDEEGRQWNPSNPFNVELSMHGQAHFRTLRDRPGQPPEVLTIDLPGSRDVKQAEFRASISAPVLGVSVGALAPSTELRGYTPGVSRWVLLIDMDEEQNPHLIPELIDDIEIRPCWVWGPPDLRFP